MFAHKLKHAHLRQEEEESTTDEAATAEILANISNAYEHPVNDFIEAQLATDYTSCAQALGDIVTWCLVLYGDWFGNKGGNTIGYY